MELVEYRRVPVANDDSERILRPTRDGHDLHVDHGTKAKHPRVFPKINLKHKLTTETTSQDSPRGQYQGIRGQDDNSQSARRPAWFVTVSWGALLILIGLGVNLGIYIWIRTSFKPTEDGVAVLFSGPCSKSSTVIDLSHLAINVVSTLLFSASNNCAQLLASPTRPEVDHAHKEGEWVHIGVISLRNFRWISRWRAGLWCLLILSSFPLHLLYNSVIFSSTYASDYFAAAVTEDFVHGGRWSANRYGWIFDSSSDQMSHNMSTLPLDATSVTNVNSSQMLQAMQDNITSLHRLESTACGAAYDSIIEAPYRSVLLVTDYSTNNSWLAAFFNTPETDESGTNFKEWLNGSLIPDRQQPGSCKNSTASLGISLPAPGDLSGSGCGIFRAGVDYCLAEPAGNYSVNCTVSASTTLLLVVIVCNAAKLICFAATLLSWRVETLAVVGDAVASFLTHPDRTTENLGTIDYFRVQDKAWRRERRSFLARYAAIRNEDRRWKGKQYRWVRAVCTWTDILIFVLMFCAWCTLLVYMSQTWNKSALGESFSNQNAQAAGSINNATAPTAPPSLAANVILVNTPQLVVSLVYAFSNLALTRMLAANEYSKFARTRRGLRVSRPTGYQRSTFWLQLPYRYSISLIATMALLHWLISRSLYLLNIRVYDISGHEDPSRAKYAYGISSLALLLSFLLGSALFFTLLALTGRKLGTGMPIIATCSVAISAACHPPADDGDAADKLLMYGAVPKSPREISGSFKDGSVSGVADHASFSSREVEPVVVGIEYDKRAKSEAAWENVT